MKYCGRRVGRGSYIYSARGWQADQTLQSISGKVSSPHLYSLSAEVRDKMRAVFLVLLAIVVVGALAAPRRGGRPTIYLFCFEHDCSETNPQLNIKLITVMINECTRLKDLVLATISIISIYLSHST